ncbi:dnaJ domain-containing protein [Artemisia annua]|uniref:DnaJ domain-containing protein n=1 Tax=Artemisia annua TaxID=35608 RepID=A0A2U1KZL0_ARTAN|nr:dnaJ domain-containing protein [Artemisia annua]
MVKPERQTARRCKGNIPICDEVRPYLCSETHSDAGFWEVHCDVSDFKEASKNHDVIIDEDSDDDHSLETVECDVSKYVEASKMHFFKDSRKTCSANKGNEVNKPKRGRPRKTQTNIDSTASPASNSASPASNKRGRPKKFSKIELIYLHSTKCVTDSILHKIPAINYWSSEKIRERDNFEFDNGGFGILDLYEKDNDDNDSSENKLDMDKLYQNVNLLEKILSDINNEFKLSSSKNPDCPRLKEIKAKFNNCIRNEYLSREDMMNKGDSDNDETMGFERESEDLAEEKEEDEKTGFENKNDDFSNVHLSDDDLGNNDSGEERQNNESTGFEKKNVDDYDKENEKADDSIGKDENENENSDDDDDLGFEKKNENESENSDVDGCSNVSKEKVFENEKKNESQSKEEVFEAKEDQELHRMQKRKQTENEIHRRQKQRVEEIRESQKKKEENINLKEQYRIEVIQRLTKLEKRTYNLRTLLFGLGMNIGPSDAEIKKGYKEALLKFHPDRAPKDDMRKKVEAEETFKLIQRMKERKEPITII